MNEEQKCTQSQQVGLVKTVGAQISFAELQIDSVAVAIVVVAAAAATGGAVVGAHTLPVAVVAAAVVVPVVVPVVVGVKTVVAVAKTLLERLPALVADMG